MGLEEIRLGYDAEHVLHLAGCEVALLREGVALSWGVDHLALVRIGGEPRYQAGNRFYSPAEVVWNNNQSLCKTT